MISVNVWFHVILFFWTLKLCGISMFDLLLVHLFFFNLLSPNPLNLNLLFSPKHSLKTTVFFFSRYFPHLKKKFLSKHHSQGKTNSWVSMWSLTIAPSMLQGADGTWPWTYFMNFFRLNDSQVGDEVRGKMSCLNDQLPTGWEFPQNGVIVREGASQNARKNQVFRNYSNLPRWV